MITVKKNYTSSIPLADVLLTGECNQNCPTCISFFEKGLGKRTMSMDEIALCTDLFLELGVEAVSVSGGEPLIVPHVSEALNYFHQHGLKVQIETNALNFQEHYIKIKDIIKWYSFSLDGHTREMNFRMRPQYPASIERWGYQFDAVLSALDALRKNESKAKVKIGSVICEENSDSVVQIGDLIRDYPNVKKWKLYQVRKSNPRYCPDERFAKIINEIERRNQMCPYPFDLVINPSRNLDNCVILTVRSDTMEVFTEVSGNEIISFGRIGYNSTESIARKIREMPEIAEGTTMRYNMTYRS
jgi:MoaA/NifB/PqqE/SkfB family radical SAM enzyme